MDTTGILAVLFILVVLVGTPWAYFRWRKLNPPLPPEQEEESRKKYRSERQRIDSTPGGKTFTFMLDLVSGLIRTLIRGLFH